MINTLAVKKLCTMSGFFRTQFFWGRTQFFL